MPPTLVRKAGLWFGQNRGSLTPKCHELITQEGRRPACGPQSKFSLTSASRVDTQDLVSSPHCEPPSSQGPKGLREHQSTLVFTSQASGPNRVEVPVPRQH